MKPLVILNAHRNLGHMSALEEAARTLAAEERGRVICVGFTTDPAITAACFRAGIQGYSKSSQPDREGHAGERETSLALHCFPELVDRGVLERLDPNFDYDVDSFLSEKKSYWDLSGGRGYFGSPGAATAETGKALLSARGQNIARVILEALRSPHEGS